MTNDFALGAVQHVAVAEDEFMANLTGQHRFRPSLDLLPFPTRRFGPALATLGEKALAMGTTVHMQRIGCGLTGGRWEPSLAGARRRCLSQVAGNPRRAGRALGMIGAIVVAQEGMVGW